MKGVFERLFDGEINPGENSNPGTEQFRDALRLSDAARTALGNTLSDEQREMLDRAFNARAEVTHLESLGFIFHRLDISSDAQAGRGGRDTDQRLRCIGHPVFPWIYRNIH